jgi:TolB-like protein
MQYLSQEEQAELMALRLRDPFSQATLIQLDRILASETFRRAKRNAKDFLGYVIVKNLLGREDDIKETMVAVHAFGEPADFDTAVHTKVRVAAGNLRQRLADYYAGEGQDDPIEIAIPTGTYVPEIRDRRIIVMVALFDNWNPIGDQAHLCTTASDEIVHQLARMPRLEARRIPMTELPNERTGYGVRGSLECRDDAVRLNVSLSDLRASRVIWDEAFEGRRDDILKLSQQVATAITTTLQPEMAKSKKRNPSHLQDSERRTQNRSVAESRSASSNPQAGLR